MSDTIGKPVEAGQSVQLLLCIVELFNKNKIPYAAIGALAGAYLGSVRASIDADALVYLASDPTIFVKELQSSSQMEGLEIHYIAPGLFDPVRGVITVQDRYFNRVDLLLGIKGVGRDLLSRVHSINIFNKELKVVGPEDYLAMKILAGSPLDLQDAKNVIAVQGQHLDKDLLLQLVNCYGEDEKKILDSLLAGQ